MIFPYQKLSITLISGLQPRAQDILARRFGLHKQEPETLEAIGQSHGITRERVRQIVEDGIQQFKESSLHKREREQLDAIFQHMTSLLAESGHVKRQDLLVQQAGDSKAANSIIFLLHLGDQFYKQKETEYVYPFWTSKKEIVEISRQLLDAVSAFMEERKEAVEFEDLAKFHNVRQQEKIHPHTLASLLEVSKRIARSYNGRWGLQEWPEVYPKGMRDKAYVVLRDVERPLHFVEVAKFIEHLQESLAGQKRKAVLPQTVHNELIKDPRFVLVGRGTYALQDWGYKPGTVKDVIREILHDNGGTMTREAIVQKTLDQRRVKESTILLNLQDKKYFFRKGEGYYCIGE